MLRLYNTLTKKVEDFIPIDPSNVSYYSCGPTVYDYAHIGHARTYIFADILERVLKFNGYKVKRVMNITDVGHLTSDSDSGIDKMEKGAAREKKSVWEIAKFYTDDFWEMCTRLNIQKPAIICKATDYITQMIELIKTLEKKGFIYKITDGMYFDTSKFKDYGKLTGQTFDQLQKTLKAGVRVEMVTGKKHPTDFALWKFSYPGGRSFDTVLDDVSLRRQMEWESPWGKGFPGWHIECSAMAMNNLGETIDIHTGGIDHIPIHHTNEIAQSEAATGKTFVKFWLHAGHLLVEGEKMSKSLGNYFRLTDIEKKGFSPLSLRYLFLTASYRLQMNFTWKSLESAKNAYGKLIDQISEIKYQRSNKNRNVEKKSIEINNIRNKFMEAINDDLNTAKALGVMWETLKSNVSSEDKYDLLVLFDEVLGLDFARLKIKDQRSEIPKEIIEMNERREKLRRENQFEKADKLREEIRKNGYLIRDSGEGSVVEKI